MQPTTHATPTTTVLPTPANKVSSWELDPAHSSANFTVRHMMVSKVHGAFSKLKASLKLDRASLSNSVVTATIEAGSIDTREGKRDEHLRSADFFDVTTYPTIIFKSKSFELVGSGTDQYRLVGDLTMHGVTKEVTLAVESANVEMKDPYGNIKLGMSATTKLNRKDFGLGWNAALEAGGFLVGDEVSVALDLEFTKEK